MRGNSRQKHVFKSKQRRHVPWRLVSIYLSVYLPFYPLTCLSINQPVYLSNISSSHPCNNQTVCTFILKPAHLFPHPFPTLSIKPPAHLSICPKTSLLFIHLYVYLTNSLSTHLPSPNVRRGVQVSACACACVRVRVNVCVCMCVC